MLSCNCLMWYCKFYVILFNVVMYSLILRAMMRRWSFDEWRLLHICKLENITICFNLNAWKCIASKIYRCTASAYEYSMILYIKNKFQWRYHKFQIITKLCRVQHNINVYFVNQNWLWKINIEFIIQRWWALLYFIHCTICKSQNNDVQLNTLHL